MNKNLIFIGCVLSFSLIGYTPVTQKEEISFQARQIKAVVSQEPLKAVVPEFHPLPEQEKLVYKAKFLGLSIGKFIIINNGKVMLNDREAYHFELTVKTLPFFSKIFKTKDRYVSYMDTQEFVVLRHEEYIKGGALLESTVDFDYKNHTATYKNLITHQESTITIPDKLLDALGGNFYLRILPVGLGDTVDFYIYADGKIYNYTGLFYSRTTVNLPNYGKQDAYSFKPYLYLNGEQIKKISAEVFFSTTTPKKTVRATLRTLIGSVNVILVEGYRPL